MVEDVPGTPPPLSSSDLGIEQVPDHMDYDEVVEKSAFEDSNILPAILITLTRIYDVQMAILGAADPGAALALAKAHEQGLLLSPPPMFVGD